MEIVTGGVSGIDTETVRILVKYGAKIVLANFNEVGVKEMAKSIVAEGGVSSHVFSNVIVE